MMTARTRATMLALVAGVALSTAMAQGTALTSLEHWSPTDATEFKTAAVCHFEPLDYYGVFAVFETTSLTGPQVDELWYLRVDGLSSWEDYGEIVAATPVATEGVISHVDCTTDGDRTAFVVWDRSDDILDTERAHWARVDLYGAVSDAYEVPNCGVGESWANGIAYHDGGIAISGAGRGECSSCSYVWPDALDPLTWERVPIWLDGQVPYATDIIWNGRDCYLFATLLRMDGTGRPAVVTAQIGADGSYIGYDAIGELSWDDCSYERIYLAFSDHHLNTSQSVLVQTDNRTFWTDPWGHPVGEPRTMPWQPLFPTCEYWGVTRRIAHTFIRVSSTTQHGAWPPLRGEPENTYTVSGNFLEPVAAGSSTGFTDAEVLLVRRGIEPTMSAENLFLHLESHDTGIFLDGFESGDTLEWSDTLP